MREKRGDRSLDSVADLTGVAKGSLSMFERGHAFPVARQLAPLERVYGPVDGWYPAGVLAALLPDLATCEGCGKELPTDSSRRRRYHGESCRSKARRLRLLSSAKVASSVAGLSAPGTNTGAEAPDDRSSLEEREEEYA
ncbi:MAG: hypothetical protein ACJ79H_21675 [Myxococcales bacterium]